MNREELLRQNAELRREVAQLKARLLERSRFANEQRQRADQLEVELRWLTARAPA